MASLRRTTFVAVFSLFLSLTARVSAQDVEEITTYPPDFNGWQLHVQDGTTSRAFTRSLRAQTLTTDRHSLPNLLRRRPVLLVVRRLRALLLLQL